jgi:hypothetical protein
MIMVTRTYLSRVTISVGCHDANLIEPEPASDLEITIFAWNARAMFVGEN